MGKKEFKFLHNYHSHTIYCYHAVNTVQDVILMAIKNGWKTIGISEHAPLNTHRKFRLNWDTIDDYIQEVSFYKRKYKDQITVLCGLEAEYDGSQYEYYKKLKDKKGIDYMILGNHNIGNPSDCKVWNVNNPDLFQYYKQYEEAAKSGLFAYCAHPDIIYRYYLKWDADAIKIAKKIIATSIKYDFPLGFNINGLRMKLVDFDYPTDMFWELVAKSKAKVIIETDAHDPYTMSQEMVDKGVALVKQWGLEKNLINKLTLQSKHLKK